MSIRDDLGPSEPTGNLRIEEPEASAAGIAGVTAAFRHLREHAGLVRGLPLLARANQHDGFDCPSCAWPDPDGGRSFAEFCENGAKAISDAGTRDVVTATSLADVTVADLARRSDRWLNDAGRLGEPMIRREGSDRFEAIGWSEAFDLIGARLRRLDDPDRAVFYTSGRASNEAAFLYQLFVRAFGTNNLPDCSNLCHESSGRALGPTIGIGKGTVMLDDFDLAEVIVVIGQNPGTNHPRMLSALQSAKEHGATIVAINPLPETGLKHFRNPQDLARPTRWAKAARGQDLADVFLPVRIGGDLALLTGLQKLLAERDAVDHGFVARSTTGWELLERHLEGEDWARIEEESGIDRGRMTEVADLLAGTDRIIWCWAMGLTQHEHAVGTIQQLVNLTLMRGAIGKPGAGLCPVRGHSNVQGDRTVGIWERPSPAFLDGLAAGVGFEPPRSHGYDVVEALKAMHAGQVDVVVALGGNLLSASPDTVFAAEALERVDLNVQIATKLNRTHLIGRGTTILLPCLARTDADVQPSGQQFVSCENSMGIVTASKGTQKPVSSHLRSEPAIVAGIAHATLGARPVPWLELVADYDRIRDLIERSIAGFDDYNRRVRAPGGFALPNPAREGHFDAVPGGRARFTAYPVPRTDLGEDELVMMTIRSHDQFNTTVYGDDDRYRGVYDERRVVFMHPEDMADRGLRAGGVVDLVNRSGGRERRAPGFQAVPFDVPRGNCATYFPEANVLVPVDSVARGSNTPTSKYVVITVEAR